jgi:hypothetical protein
VILGLLVLVLVELLLGGPGEATSGAVGGLELVVSLAGAVEFRGDSGPEFMVTHANKEAVLALLSCSCTLFAPKRLLRLYRVLPPTEVHKGTTEHLKLPICQKC